MKNSLIVFLCLFGNFTFAQSGSIKGVVSDENGDLPGVHVQVFEKGLGTISDGNGNFEIPDIPVGDYTITFSFLGFSEKEIKNVQIENGKNVDLGSIVMEESAFDLNQITVTPGSFSVLGSPKLSRQTLSEKDLKNMSWAEDITRAVARLPGVSSNDFSSKFTIRGGEADEVLMILDGMELYEPFHQRDFSGGLFSIVDIETIQGIDLLTGGFSAEFGQRQSGVFQMRTKNIADDQRTTSIGLSAMNARIYTDGKFADNKGSYLVSGRRGMLDLLLKAIGSTETLPSFYDAMGKVQYRLTPRHEISFHALHAGDKSSIRDIKPDNFDRHDTKYQNSYAWLTLKSEVTPDLYVRSMLYSGLISHQRDGLFSKRDYTAKGDFSLNDRRSYNFFGVKQDWSWDVSKRFALKGGFDLRQLNADYDYSHSITEIRVNSLDSLYIFQRDIDIQAKPSGQLGNAYLSGRFQVLERLFLETGLRYDVATYADDKVWSPRVSLAYAFGKNTFLRGAWGKYYQSQFINNLDVNHNGTTFNPAELSTHYVLGFEHLLKNGISLRVEAYNKEISNVSPIYQNLRDPWEVFPESRDDVVRLDLNSANAKGLEFFVKYDLGKKFSWWFSYALAKAVDDIKHIEFDGIFEEKTGSQLRPNNQLHTIYADVNYRFNKKWHFSLSWQMYKGWPRTTYTFAHQKLPESNKLGQETLALFPEGDLHFYPKHELFNGIQYPAYHRMDLRVNRNFQLKNSKVTAFLHLVNLYNQFNLRKFDLGVTDEDEVLIRDENGNSISERDDEGWFGLTPIMGASWEF